jgi:SAM-dependent methyltransferase
MLNQKDLFGQALYDYWHKNNPQDMLTWTQLTEKEVLPVSYLFRSYDEMPEPEQVALKLSKGKILDVGAGSGTHSLYLQKQGKDVTALEISEISCRLMRERGVKNIIQSDFFEFSGQKFDTILFLMNGIGIVEKAIYAGRLFEKVQELLTPEGQALIHSSDLKYLYQTPAGYQMPKEGYYGDVRFFVQYKDDIQSFDWTYIDEQTLQIFANQYGFSAEKIAESEYGDFLLQVKFKNNKYN